MNNNILEIRKEAKNNGFITIPLQLGKSPSKSYFKNGEIYFKKIDDDFNELRINKRSCNVGIITGEESGIFVLDLDIPNGHLNFNKLLNDNNLTTIEDLKTPYVKTPSGGYHIYFKFDSKLKKLGNAGTNIKLNIDFKSNNQLVVYPGSIYPGCKVGKHKCGIEEGEKCKFKGKKYKWEKPPISSDDFKFMPDFLFQFLCKVFKNISNDIKATAPVINKGKYDNIINNTNNINILKTDMNDNEIKDKLNQVHKSLDDKREENILKGVELLDNVRIEDRTKWLNLVWCLKGIGINEEKIHEISKKSEKYNKKNLDDILNQFDDINNIWTTEVLKKWIINDVKHTSIELTNILDNINWDIDETYLLNGDIALCVLFIRKCYNMIRINKNTNELYIWDNGKKLWSNEINLIQYVSLFLTGYYNIYAKVDKTNLSLMKTQKAYTGYTKILGVVKLIEKNITTIVEKIDFDKPSEFLPLKNGKVINLKTLEDRDRQLDDYFTYELDWNYKKHEDYTLANKYFLSLANENEELSLYLKRLCGYAITDQIKDRSLYILYGTGMNGKSALLENIIVPMLSEKQVECIGDSVFSSYVNKSSANPELVRVKNKRVLYHSELASGCHLNEKVIKQITGGDSITCRNLYTEPITFTSTGKMFLLTNEKPSFNGSQKAMVDRIKLIPFDGCFDKKEDTEFFNEILENKEQIYSYICTYAHEYYNSGKNNLEVPEIVNMYIDEYVKENSPVESYINENCVITNDKNDYIFTTNFMSGLTTYLGDGTKQITSTIVNNILKHKYNIVKMGRRHDGYQERAYIGIKFKDIESDNDELE
jgi:P4 family phage/plasmid primase-like protien